MSEKVEECVNFRQVCANVVYASAIRVIKSKMLGIAGLEIAGERAREHAIILSLIDDILKLERKRGSKSSM